MRQTRSFCRICEPLCPMVATVDDQDEIVKLEPDRAHPISKGFACHKGLNFIDVHKDPERLNYPMRRTSPKGQLPATFERVSWDEAMADIGMRLRAIRDRHGPDALSVYFGNPVSLNSNAFPLAASLGMKIGSHRNFNSGTQDTTNKPAATEAVFGTLNLFPVPDFENTHYLLCLGANPKVSHWTYTSVHRPMSVLQAIVARGGQVRFINPRKIESASPTTGDVTQIKPDTDLYFLAALLHELEAMGLFDAPHVAQLGRNLEGLRDFIRDYAPERVAPITGISAEEICSIAKAYADAPAASVYMATGINQSRQGTLAYWLLMMLSFISGNLGRKGGDYYARGFYPNARPIQHQAPLQVPVGDGVVEEIGGALPAHAMGELILAQDHPIRAMIFLSGNPILSVPGEALLREAFPKLELMVHVDIFRNATSEYADYLLPAADWLERAECNLSANGMQQQPFVQYADAVVTPRYERRDDWWIISRLQQELGIPSALDDEKPDMHGRMRKILSRLDLSPEKLRDMPGQSALLPKAEPERFFTDVVGHADGKVDCCPAHFAPSIARAHHIFAELAAEPADQLKLISLRTNYMHNSNLANMPILKRAPHGSNALHMHPDDAMRLQLRDGEMVDIRNRHGQISAPLHIDPSLRTGVVAMAHGYGHQHSYGLSRARATPGANVNAIMPMGVGSAEPLSNMAQLTGVPVEVSRARGV